MPRKKYGRRTKGHWEKVIDANGVLSVWDIGVEKYLRRENMCDGRICVKGEQYEEMKGRRDEQVKEHAKGEHTELHTER